jgi:hypothetical protein
MAEKNSAEARVELAEMRENLSDQVFISSLPVVGGNGGRGGSKAPMGEAMRRRHKFPPPLVPPSSRKGWPANVCPKHYIRDMRAHYLHVRSRSKGSRFRVYVLGFRVYQCVWVKI